MDPAILEARVGPKLTVYDGKTSKDVLINDPTSHCYIPQPRFDHCSVLIDDKLFVHRGRGCTFNKANLEEYDTVSEQWKCRTTSGDIPEPFSGMASARKGKMLYTFGGEIQAKMYTNVVSELNTSSLIWRMLHPTNPENAPVPKRDAAMMSYKDYLVIFGGFSVSAGSSRNATYDKKGVNQVWTNEVTIFDVNRSQWIWEKISGHAPKPCGECTLTYIGQDKAILLGGLGKSGQVKNGPMNTVKLLELSNWSWISLRCKAQHINDFPKNCYGHCTISLHEVQDSQTDPSVVLLWGRTGQMSYQDDMWQLTISSDGGIWRKIVFLEGTCTRCPPAYKFSAEIIQTPSSLQLIRFGGMTMGKRFPLEDTWIVDLAVNPSKINEIGVVHCRIPRPDSDVDYESVDIAKNADNISDEVFLETAESSHKDDSEPHNTVSNAHATKESSPVTSPNSKEMSKDTCEHQTINADTQPLVKIEQYPGLNFFNQREEREIKYSAEEQHLEMKDMGLSMTIPPEAIVPQENPVHLTVTPAVHGNIRIPEDCRPHSPMYMLSPLKLAKDAKVTVSHTCLIEDEEDSNNMVVLVPVNLAEAQASGVYTLKEIDVEKKFEKGSQEGEIKLRQLQPFRVAKRVSRRPDNKLFTARVYKKNHDFCTPDDVVIFSVTPRQASYIKVLEEVMKKSYPHLKLIETYDSLRFKDDCNKVTLLFPKSGEIGKWDMHTMKDTITRDAIDPPDGYDITNLDYSPMIRLRVINNGPQPSQSRTKYSIKVHGFLEDFEIKLIFELLEMRDQRLPSFQLHRKSICKDDHNGQVVLIPPRLYKEDTVLQLQDLRVLCNSLKEVSPSWNFIGLELQLPLYILKNIADSLALLVSGNEAYFREMLSTWLQSISEPEVKTVRRLKEALIRTSNDVAASNLLDEINHDYERKYKTDISKEIKDFQIFLGSWISNDMTAMGHSVANFLDKIIHSDFSEATKLAEDIHRTCKSLTNDQLIHNFISCDVYPKDINSSKEIILQVSCKLLEIISQKESLSDVLHEILQYAQSLLVSIQNFFVQMESASLHVQDGLLKWKRKLEYSKSVPDKLFK